MAGHSHWAGIKHKKKVVDAKRGKLFSKLAKNIMCAARTGGGAVDTNLDLAYAIQRAKDANMPKENIERALKKGTGEIPGQSLEWVQYEGFGPEGVAILVQALTDNKTRTVAELRHLFDKKNGTMGAQGSVAWMFERKGLITLDADGTDEDQLMLTALDAGADDVIASNDIFEIHCKPEIVRDIRQKLEDSGFKVQSGDVSQIPSSNIKLGEDGARKVLSLLDALEEHEDVQNIFANFEVEEGVLEQLA